MNLKAFNKFCKSLPSAKYSIQWRGSHVWKIGGKVFAIGLWNNAKYPGITLKVSKITFECLKNEPGIRPAPYLASRGMSWLQFFNKEIISNDVLKVHLNESYSLVSESLSKKRQRELGIYNQ